MSATLIIDGFVSCPYCHSGLAFEDTEQGSMGEFYGYLDCPVCHSVLEVNNEISVKLYLIKPKNEHLFCSNEKK